MVFQLMCDAEPETDSSREDRVICVTGTWGLLGGWIVKQLLERGYSVRTTICISPDEASALMACPGAEQRLKLMEADLLDYFSLSKVIKGCVGVVHASAPHDFNGIGEYPADMIEFEVRGTLNVVEACANSECVHRLVLTSCLSAIVFTSQTPKDMILDESCWTDLNFCKERKLWSPLSKTLTERAAWALAIDKGLDMVVINPATVVGSSCSNPPQYDTHNNNQQPAADWQGKRWIPAAAASAEDVAAAHIQAFENPLASGRYICFDHNLQRTSSNAAIHGDLFPVSSRLREEDCCSYQLSNQKLLDLGMTFAHSYLN